ncbi:MAG: riboflavin biosynthesis protein RibF [Victivallaceae bacterium]
MSEIFANNHLIGRRLALGIGVFDGVHRGHQLLLSELVAMARRTGASPVAMTFAPHPRAVLFPHDPPKQLMPLPERLQWLKYYGAEEVAVIHFSPDFAALPAGEFLSRLLDFPAEITGICVGASWRFGAGAEGDAGLLKEWTAARHIEFIPVPELSIDGIVVSSSAIRRAITAGRLAEAEKLLGRPYRLTGVVEHGYNVAGRALSRPTANVRPAIGVLPPDGVYAGRAFVDGRAYLAAINLGVSPTFGWTGGERRLEVHLLDFTGDLYGNVIGIELVSYLRPERTFAGAEELKVQIEQDIAAIRQFFADRPQESLNHE